MNNLSNNDYDAIHTFHKIYPGYSLEMYGDALNNSFKFVMEKDGVTDNFEIGDPSRFLSNTTFQFALAEKLKACRLRIEGKVETITPNDLRKAAECVYLACDESVANDISAKLMWAADEIERLRGCDK